MRSTVSTHRSSYNGYYSCYCSRVVLLNNLKNGGFHAATLVSLDQMFWNFHTMCLALIHRYIMSFAIRKLCTGLTLLEEETSISYIWTHLFIFLFDFMLTLCCSDYQNGVPVLFPSNWYYTFVLENISDQRGFYFASKLCRDIILVYIYKIRIDVQSLIDVQSSNRHPILKYMAVFHFLKSMFIEKAWIQFVIEGQYIFGVQI